MYFEAYEDGTVIEFKIYLPIDTRTIGCYKDPRLKKELDMDSNTVRQHVRVRTTKLVEIPITNIGEKHLAVRKPSVTGTLFSYVPGYLGLVWFVRHEGTEDIGVYCLDELELVR